MHRLRARATLTALSLATLFAASSFGQTWRGRGRLYGEVRDEGGKAVAGATVTLRLQAEATKGPEPVQTDKHGKWSILGLASAVWSVSIEAPGFEPSLSAARVDEQGGHPALKITLRAAAPGGDPQAAQARAALDRAALLLQEKKATEARLELESALALLEGASRLPVLKRIAVCQVMEANDAGAVDTLKRVLAESPDDAEALRLIVDRLIVLRRDAEAQEYMARLPAESLDPNTLLNLGINAYNGNLLEEATAKFDLVVAARPDWPDVYYYRGLAYLAQGRSAEAKADFEKLLSLDASHRFAGDCREFLKSL